MAVSKEFTYHATDINASQFLGHCRSSEYSLTVADRIGIERFLRFAANSHVVYSPILIGLLQHKLRNSRPAPDPTPASLATSGREVTYMISGAGAVKGVLSFGLVCRAGELPVHTLLGATLLGMKPLQKSALLNEDGDIGTVVVLNVATPHAPEHT